ncbi:C6 zinc finger domain protein [Aspergillus heteromorphus CBS 117.55]|uniref:C6 zinc finger domain protein n=1 Tax=Aspergillus heteromorphus CBS 117.55 TaxID=1448321 RepID=A0A317WNZ3_9EURO|nr:C6 zinc finger domain protein [Aspergillus heteromorphus CBS 117.55]PWY88209.1 C6 zinc finger domain protein [Aspergillus heteromorphus CBS 117.55]
MTVSPPPSQSLRGLSPVGPLRSRRGCTTCKIRKVKCGEEKPHCIRCTSTGRKCEYQGQIAGTFSSASSSPTISIHDTSLSFLPNTVWRERRAFAYYFQQAAPFVGGELDVDFWRTTIPQVCRSEPAVWDAIISISALFESPEPCPDLVLSRRRDVQHTLNQNHRDAMGWYSRSVSAVRRRIERGDVDIFVGLISCVLFICIEALQGGSDEAVRLYAQGVHLIFALRAQIAAGAVSATKAFLLEDIIVPVFVRLGEIAMSDPANLLVALLPTTQRTSTQEFPSLRAAREAIVLLLADVQLLERNYEEHLTETNSFDVPDELLTRQTLLSERILNWHTAFTNLINSLRSKDVLSPQQISSSTLLSACHKTLFIQLSICLSPFQTTPDAYEPLFQTIVDESRMVLDGSGRSDGTQPPFTYDISVGLPLWFTSLRCREPTLRRAALALLRRAPQILGFYKSADGVMFAEGVMMLEEAYAQAMNAQRADDSVPELTNDLPIQAIDAGTTPDTNPVPIPKAMAMSINTNKPTALLIPEEARMGPVRMFRASEGFPPETPDDEIAKWSHSPDQGFLRFSRNKLDPATNTWHRVHGYMPIMM